MSVNYDEKRYFELSEPKPAFSKFFATLDISNWLETENISQVNFSAKERDEDGGDVSSTVLDPAKNTYTGALLKPYIQAGEEDKRYRATITVQTVEQSYEVFYIDWRIKSG